MLRHWYIQLRDYLWAVWDTPSGVICGHCGRVNDHFDDCGFFIWRDRATCRACFPDEARGDR